MPDLPSGIRRFVYPAALAVAVLLSVFLWGAIDWQAPEFADADLHAYRAVAAAAPGVPDNVRQPFAYRLLGPWIAGVLPLPDPAAFRLMAIAAALALVLLMYRFFRDEGIERAVAAFTVLLFMCNRYVYGFPVWNYFQVNDLFALVAVILFLTAMRRGQWGMFGAVLAVGVLARETPLVAIPAAAVLLASHGASRREWGRMIGASLPGIAVFAAVRLLVPASGGYSLAEAASVYAGKFLSPGTWAALLVIPFAPLSFLPLVYPRQTASFIRSNPHLAALFVLILASTVFGHDNQRLMAPAAPVFFLLIAAILQREFYSRSLSWAFRIVLLLAAIAAGTHHTVGRFLLPDRQATVLVTAAATALVTAVALIRRLAGKRLPDRHDAS